MPLDLKGVNVAGLNALFPQKPKRNPFVAGLSSGVDQLQGLGYNAAAAVSDAVGLNRARDWLLDRAALNQDEAYANGRPDLEMIEDQDLSTALPYAAYQISKQVPQIGAALGIGALTGGAGLVPAAAARGAAALPTVVGGGGLRAGMDFAARRAALEAGQRFAGNVVGGAGFGTAMGAGALYGESVEAGDPSPYAALAAAPLYGVTEGIPTAVLGGTLAKGAFRGGLGTRMAKAGGVNALGGVTSELTQNEMEMAFNPTLTPEEIASRRLNAAVVGGLAEGTIGSLGGLRRPPQPVNLLPGANLSETADQPPAAPPLQLGFSGYDTGVGPLVTFPDGSTMTRAEYERYVMNMPQGPDPLGAYVPDRRFQYTGALDFTPTDLLAPQGPVRPGLQVPLVPGQGDLFDPLMEGLQPTPAVVDPAVGRSEEMGALFEAYPDALVRTEYGLPQITAALRNANAGKYNAQLGRFIPEFSRAIEQGPAAVDALIAQYDNSNSTLRPEVFETAAQMAQDFQSRLINAQAAGGVRRAQPGVTVGTRPNYDASADAAADTQERILEQEAGQREQEAGQRQRQQFTGAIADTDARVQGAREQQSAQGRRSVLDGALDGAANAGNARNRFIKALRKQGYRDTIVRPEEQAVIERYFAAADAFPAEGSQVQSAPNEMGDVVPERVEREPQKAGKPARQNENRSFRLTPPPSTEADLEALAKAQAKRDRKAGTEEPPPAAEGSTPRQGILFTKKGEPAAKADQAPEQRKPRKARVKAKIEDQEVELEVDDADAKMAAMKKDIDMYESFIACLRKK